MTVTEPSRSPRVLQISTVHQPFDNRIFHKECRSLQEAGFDVHLLVTGTEDQVRAGVQVHGLERPAGRRGRLLLAGAVLKKARALRPDLVHVHDPELIPVGLAAARSTGAKFVYDSHEDLIKQLVDKPYIRPDSGASGSVSS